MRSCHIISQNFTRLFGGFFEELLIDPIPRVPVQRVVTSDSRCMMRKSSVIDRKTTNIITSFLRSSPVISGRLEITTGDTVSYMMNFPKLRSMYLSSSLLFSLYTCTCKYTWQCQLDEGNCRH